MAASDQDLDGVLSDVVSGFGRALCSARRVIDREHEGGCRRH